tara:strand:- start:13 stop:216 length:204 start_codon:yes stop_codon:yes gene_type:complete
MVSKRLGDLQVELCEAELVLQSTSLSSIQKGPRGHQALLRLAQYHLAESILCLTKLSAEVENSATEL